MVETRITLTPQFAVPIAEAFLNPCEPLNSELEKLFLEREDDAHRNPTPSHIPQQEVFESRFNLFQWPESCVRELRQFVLDAVVGTVMSATTLERADLARLTLHNHTWFHVTRYARPHFHFPQSPDGLLVCGVLRARRGSGAGPARQRPAPIV